MSFESRKSLSQNLEALLEQANGQSLTLEGVFRGVGDKAFGLLLAILALPSALPVQPCPTGKMSGKVSASLRGLSRLTPRI